MAQVTNSTISLRLRRDLARIEQQTARTMERLSTGLRINRAADDPGGLLISEKLHGEARGAAVASESIQRAANLIATADAALGQVGDLLRSLQGLVVETANTGGLNDEQLAANQLQVDSILDSIRRLAANTTFAGLNLLDGTLDYRTSGVASAAVGGVEIARARLDGADHLPVRVEVTTSAAAGLLQFRTSQTAGAAQVRLAGAAGAESFNFASGAAASAILFAVNQASDLTGVAAEWINAANPASGVQFVSADVGSAAFVSVEAMAGGFQTTDAAGRAAGRASGRDAAGTINGMAAAGAGNALRVASPSLAMMVRLADGFATGTTAFAITGGGATFQVGARSGSAHQVELSLPSADPAALGDGAGGWISQLGAGGSLALSAGGDAEAAGRVVAGAIEQVAAARGRLGGVAAYALADQADSMVALNENLTASESAVRDADFAAETAHLTRSQMLTQVAVSLMATANATRQTALLLLQ